MPPIYYIGYYSRYNFLGSVLKDKISDPERVIKLRNILQLFNNIARENHENVNGE